MNKDDGTEGRDAMTHVAKVDGQLKRCVEQVAVD